MEAGLNTSLELQCRKTMEIRTKKVRAGFAAGLEGLKAMEIGAKQYDKEGAFFGPQNVRKTRRAKMGLPSRDQRFHFLALFESSFCLHGSIRAATGRVLCGRALLLGFHPDTHKSILFALDFHLGFKEGLRGRHSLNHFDIGSLSRPITFRVFLRAAGRDTRLGARGIHSADHCVNFNSPTTFFGRFFPRSQAARATSSVTGFVSSLVSSCQPSRPGHSRQWDWKVR